MTKLVVAGALGRMGTAIINLAFRDSDLKVVYGLESLSKVSTTSALPCPIGSDISQIAKADVVINFTTPEGLMGELRPAMENYEKPWVIGTTGFNEQQESALRKISEKIPIV